MKQFLPYIFPAAALLVVIFLTFRWYSQNTTGIGQISEFAEGVEIEQLTDDEQAIVSRGLGDIKTVQLERVDKGDLTAESDLETATESALVEESSKYAGATGQVRYEVVDGRVRFSVIASLPYLSENTTTVYQVWLKDVNSDAVRKAFVLEYSKAGYVGSAAISADTLPFEVMISELTAGMDTLTNPILRAVIEQEEEVSEEVLQEESGS